MSISPSSLLPHRHPFLLLDSIEEIVSGVRARGIRVPTAGEAVMAGHMPGQPIVPGVLVIESLAQLGGCVFAREGEAVMGYLASLHDFRFRKPIVPGDRVVLEVEVVRKLPPLVRFHGRAIVGEVVVAEGEFTISAELPKAG